LLNVNVIRTCTLYSYVTTEHTLNYQKRGIPQHQSHLGTPNKIITIESMYTCTCICTFQMSN